MKNGWSSDLAQPVPSVLSARMANLQIIGGGRMGEAILIGLLSAGTSPSDVVVVEPAAPRRAELEERHGVATTSTPTSAPDAVVAVKPQYVTEVVRDAAAAGVRRLVSVAAGVTLASLGGAAGPEVTVIRAMPNTPALVGRGAAALAAPAGTSDDDVAWAVSMLDAVGVAVVVDEAALDAVTGLSGSGPAYVFLVAEAMIEAGVLNGLPRPLATTLAVQTIAGAGELLTGGTPPAELRGDVTSPGGTTAAGLRALEDHGVRSAFLDAVSRATARSRELGRTDDD